MSCGRRVMLLAALPGGPSSASQPARAGRVASLSGRRAGAAVADLAPGTLADAQGPAFLAL